MQYAPFVPFSCRPRLDDFEIVFLLKGPDCNDSEKENIIINRNVGAINIWK